MKECRLPQLNQEFTELQTEIAQNQELRHALELAVSATDEVSVVVTETEIFNTTSSPEMLQAALQLVNMKRGAVQEPVILDTLQTKSNVLIDKRNDKYYIQYSKSYALGGFTDGQTADTVVEVKSRRRKWNRPPIYDLLQTFCYMHLAKKEKGMLVEKFMDGTVRETEIHWNQQVWDVIDESLTTIASKVMLASADHMQTLLDAAERRDVAFLLLAGELLIKLHETVLPFFSALPSTAVV